MSTAFRSVNARIALIPTVALIALALVGLLAVKTISSITISEHQARARVAVEAAMKIVTSFEERAAKGEMTEAAAQDAAKAVMRAIRYDGDEYMFVRDGKGFILVNGLFPNRENIQTIDAKDANGFEYSRAMIASAQAGGGFVDYMWPKKPNTPPVRKTSYNLQTPGWKWIVGSGIYLDDVEAAVWDNAARIAGLIAVVALATFALAFWLGRRITKPILGLAASTRRLADGDHAAAVPGTDRGDEIGTLAQAIAVLKDRSAEATRLATEQERVKEEAARERQAAMRNLADGFERTVKAVVDRMAASAGDMERSATGMMTATATAGREAATAADAAEQTSANVGTVAAATEELAASIQEISRQVSNSSQIAADAVSGAQQASTAMDQLADSAKRVGDIVALISGIAAQTNLLALNATIEAARAGEAGKGFAVVAGEVKSLATQTARATEEIQATVEAIQSMTGTAGTAIAGIGDTVGRMNEITTAVAAAVEEQGAATREIAGNVQRASAGTRQVSGSVNAAQSAVKDTGSVAAGVLDAAGVLSREAEHLRGEVSSFLGNVRAA